ncbi:hypothetical protein BGZ98_000046 [Dissophora globulifera]|nr:hypothetical protein BGZ98_000046 [Dissophora globulifera]
MASITIQLEKLYLVLPASAESSTASLDSHAPPSAPLPSTAVLKGSVILTLHKPIQVASLSVILDGSSYLALSAPRGATTTSMSKRLAHYSRHHLRLQQFLIEPSPDPEKSTTIVTPSASGISIYNAMTPSSTSLGSSYLEANQIAYPFAIEVPNNVPVSVVTPHGGTVYRLTAELRVAKQKSKSSSSSGFMATLMSAATSGGAGSVISAATTVHIYRTGFLRHPRDHRGASGDETPRDHGTEGSQQQEQQEQQRAQEWQAVLPLRQQEDESVNDNMDSNRALTPASISFSWSDHLDASVSIPYTHLPPHSRLDLRFQVRVLRHDCLAVKRFQVALWERAVFRVARTSMTDTSVQSIHGTETRMAVVGIRERAITTQRLDKGWSEAPSLTPPNSAMIEKTFEFQTPSTVRGYDELYSSHNCNPSTYDRILDLESLDMREDGDYSRADLINVELGRIEIEIQHFLRCSLFVFGTLLGSNGEIVERQLGDIPVVVGGIPGGTDCDVTGLPTYIGSFSTSLLSMEAMQEYETTARASMTISDMTADSMGVRERFSMGDRQRDSRLSFTSGASSPTLNEDYENDTEFMTIMGVMEHRTPPRYESSVDRSS